MRAVTFTMRRAAGFHPASKQLIATGDVTRERLYRLNVLNDGTCVVLVRVQGDLDTVERVASERDDVLGFSVSRLAASEGLVYVHTEPPEVVREFVAIPKHHEVFFDFPLEGVGENALRVTMVGETDELLREALDEVPDGVETTVERVGEYPPDETDLSALLTERQREVLETAIEQGYYDSPRAATHEDLAAALELAPATVAEHLQKVEARVFRTLYAQTG